MQSNEELQSVNEENNELNTEDSININNNNSSCEPINDDNNIQSLENPIQPQANESNFRKCSITPKQVEEMYIKLELKKRQLTGVWATDNIQNLAYLKLPKNVEGVVGRLDKWMIKTLDTCRFQTFPWVKIEFEAMLHKPLADSKQLFSLAMKSIEPIAIPIALFSARFEFLQEAERKALILGVDIPIRYLKKFVESQIFQNEIEQNEELSEMDKAKLQNENVNNLKKLWESNDISKDRYRSFSMYFYSLRETCTLPYIVVHSIPSNSYLFLYFRYGEEIDPKFHHSFLDIYKMGGRNEDGKGDIDYEFMYWKVTHNPASMHLPSVYCENPSCRKFSITNNYSKHGFLNHIDPRQKELNVELKRTMQQLWAEKYEPLIQDQFPSHLLGSALLPDETEEQRLQRVQRSLFSQYEEEAAKDEEILRNQLITQHLHHKLLRCGKCKAVYYCSADCQRSDWPRHKSICI